MARLVVEQIPVLSDNYVFLLHDSATGTTAVVDPGDAPPVLNALSARGWTLSQILLTHHHHDHVGGVAQLVAATGARVIGHRADVPRLPALDLALSDGDSVAVGDCVAQVLDTPGHTLGHVCYHFAQDDCLFSGDTLFSLGCGRLFEGTAEQMWNSLRRLRALPGTTLIYCAHEYTASNARFAAAIDPGNPVLGSMTARIHRQRDHSLPTIPASLAEEREANPFLRADLPEIKAALGMPPMAADFASFAALRARKDAFT